MTLKKYHQKRQFDKTPEPKGKTGRSKGALRFVVQKHAASRLHYDFRLELEGTLKSWAVPKGPSLNPADKRLAIMVEDHPLDYRTFEGTIPAGNYGAGTVMVWDQGTYHAVGVDESAGHKESEKLIADGLATGHLHFVLEGEKLKGEFSLVKLQHGEKNGWLLLKKRDNFAATDDIAESDRSVVSKRSMAEISEGAESSSQAKKKDADLAGAPRGAVPTKVRPMLATLVDEPFDRAGWLFEIKWDGYRAIAEVHQGRVRLYSRNQLGFEDRYPAIVEALKKLGHDAVLDGEIVMLDAKGKPRFELMQNYLQGARGQLAYYIFDILYADGRDLRKLPLTRRKEILREIVAPSGSLQLSEHIEQGGKGFFKAAEKQGLEGIMAKDGNSPYLEGQRSGFWLKIKTQQRQEAVIGGFTSGRGSRQGFGALVLGVYDGKELVYIGHTGGGFSGARLREVQALLEPLVQNACPFKVQPKTNAPVRWVRPRLVCEVKFSEWTSDGIMRQPIFLGIRTDKPAREVRREEPKSAHAVVVKPARAFGKTSGKKPATRARTGRKSPGSNGKVTHRNRSLELTHLDKVYWPKENITKGDLIDYYREISSYILPYLHDRPESLHRHPNGIEHEGFFQKDVDHQVPDWVQTELIWSDSNSKKIRYALCQDEQTLLYLANLGCIEMNPWNSRVGALENPDYLVIDLDPQEVAFPQTIEVAQKVRRVLEDAGARCFCKTSGKRGLHIYVPLAARYDYDIARQFAQTIATMVAGEMPKLTSVARSPADRKKKVYLDYLQNRRGQTLAAPYSVRPFPGATVSTPIAWSELKRGFEPGKFTIATIPKRLKRVGDLWQDVLGEGIDLLDCLDRLTANA